MASKTVKRDRQQEELESLLENRRYRFRELLGENWPEDDIESLARGNEYPGKLEKMLKEGCPPRTALKILI